MEGDFLPVKEGKRGTMYHKIDDDAWFIMNHKSSKPALKRDYYECSKCVLSNTFLFIIHRSWKGTSYLDNFLISKF